MFFNKKLINRIEELEKKLFHLENKDRAEAFIKEYIKYEPKEIAPVYANGHIFTHGSGYFSYTVENFECAVLCELRKKKLEKLSRKKK